MLFTARPYEPHIGKRRRHTAEEDDQFAMRGSALASRWRPEAPEGHHTAKATNVQQAAADQSAGQSAADREAADSAAADQAAAGQAAADQAAADQAAADQAVADQAASDQEAVQAAAGSGQVAAQNINFQATAAHASVIQQLAAVEGDDHQSTGPLSTARGTADSASRSPSETAAIYSQALAVKDTPSTTSEPMLSGLPASTDLRAFPESPLSTEKQPQQNRTQSTLSGWLTHTSPDSASKAGAGVLAETHNEGAATTECMDCMVGRAASAKAASATASATAGEMETPADSVTAAPALNLAGDDAMARTLSQSLQSSARVRHVSAKQLCSSFLPFHRVFFVCQA